MQKEGDFLFGIVNLHNLLEEFLQERSWLLNEESEENCGKIVFLKDPDQILIMLGSIKFQFMPTKDELT
jgi:hypothetical protein